MCGLAGFTAIASDTDRLMLVTALGVGIDQRGDAMAGFISLRAGKIDYQRKTGGWTKASFEWHADAASGKMCMMHSRAPGWYAPIGDAHPFAIERNDRTVLWGAHNGALNEAWSSAKKHDRVITVDSQELFHLLADGDLAALQSMHGYGVVEWVEASNLRQIKISRLSKSSELVAVSLEEGGVVWASTSRILKKALDFADLHAKEEIDVSEIGVTYLVTHEGIARSNESGVMLSSYGSRYA